METDPIVLRESDTRRLIFQPMIVDKPSAPVRGVFVWQRKRADDEWEDITGESLKKLKAGEGYALLLRSDEVALCATSERLPSGPQMPALDEKQEQAATCETAS